MDTFYDDKLDHAFLLFVDTYFRFSLLSNLFDIPAGVKLKSSVIFHNNPQHDGLSKLSLAIFLVELYFSVQFRSIHRLQALAADLILLLN